MNKYERGMREWMAAPLKTWNVRDSLTNKRFQVEAKTKDAARVMVRVRYGIPAVRAVVSVVKTKKEAA